MSPSVEAVPSDALAIAQQLSLERLKAQKGVSPEAIAEYDWALVEVESRLHQPVISSDRLKSLGGQYGEIGVTLENGDLWMARPNRPHRKLVPLSSDGLFGIDGVDAVRVRFSKDALQMLSQVGPPSRTYLRKRE